MKAVTASILLADDEAGFRDLFRFAMEPLGHQVTAVGDGVLAVEAARQRHFDLVVLDHHMPRRTGLDALRELRSLLPETPVLMLSGSADFPAELEAEALARGARRFLFKPCELPEIIAAVEGLLEGRP